MSGIILPTSLLPDAPSCWQMASLWLWLQLPFFWLCIPFVKTPAPVPGNQCLRVLTADWGLHSLSCSALHVQLDSWVECCAWMPPAASATGFSAILPAQTLTLGILICVNDTNVFSVIWWFWHPFCLQWWSHLFLAHLCQEYLQLCFWQQQLRLNYPSPVLSHIALTGHPQWRHWYPVLQTLCCVAVTLRALAQLFPPAFQVGQ